MIKWSLISLLIASLVDFYFISSSTPRCPHQLISFLRVHMLISAHSTPLCFQFFTAFSIFFPRNLRTLRVIFSSNYIFRVAEETTTQLKNQGGCLGNSPCHGIMFDLRDFWQRFQWTWLPSQPQLSPLLLLLSSFVVMGKDWISVCRFPFQLNHPFLTFFLFPLISFTSRWRVLSSRFNDSMTKSQSCFL